MRRLGSIRLVSALLGIHLGAAAMQAQEPSFAGWWGLMGTFFWIDPKADLIAMVWTQFSTGARVPARARLSKARIRGRREVSC